MQKRITRKEMKQILPEAFKAVDSGEHARDVAARYGIGYSTLCKKLAARRPRKQTALTSAFDARSFAAEIYSSNLSRKTKLFVLELAL